MKLLRARHLGMCFGVRDAITLATGETRRRPLTILGELVHNDRVNASLRARGVLLEKDLPEVRTPAVMITAHGASDRAIGRARAAGHEVIEATCPLVHHAHAALRELVASGHHPVIVGRSDHVEVRGMTEDLREHDVIFAEADVARLPPRERFGVVAQTTQPVERVHRLVELLRRRFPRSTVLLRDTVCQPTKLRQRAAEELARACDVVVVVGGRHSNNTRELAETCARHCPSVVRVQDAGELRRLWFYGAGTVGVTAGTSTPDAEIAAVEERLREFAREAATSHPTTPLAEHELAA